MRNLNEDSDYILTAQNKTNTINVYNLIKLVPCYGTYSKSNGMTVKIKSISLRVFLLCPGAFTKDGLSKTFKVNFEVGEDIIISFLLANDNIQTIYKTIYKNTFNQTNI